MGASVWSYVVPYQPDIASALEQLRRDVYARGDYYHGYDPARYAMSEAEYRAELARNHNEYYDGSGDDWFVEQWLKVKRLPAPSDPDSLLAVQPEDGTHSIIDMGNGVSTTPAFCTVSPLTDEELVAATGTTRPTGAQVRQHLCDNRERWVGTYVVSYLNDEPHELHFFGHSGD